MLPFEDDDEVRPCGSGNEGDPFERDDDCGHDPFERDADDEGIPL